MGRLILSFLAVLVIAIAGAYFFGRCHRDDFNPDQPPEIIPEEFVLDGLPPGEDSIWRDLKYRENPARRRGVARDAARDEAIAFVESAGDSAAPATLPFVRGRFDDDGLALAIGDSKGDVQRADFSCPQPCDFGTRDDEIFSESGRKLFRIEFGEYLWQCGLAGGVGAAVGQWGPSEISDPLGPVGGAAIGSGACTILKLTF